MSGPLPREVPTEVDPDIYCPPECLRTGMCVRACSPLPKDDE